MENMNAVFQRIGLSAQLCDNTGFDREVYARQQVAFFNSRGFGPGPYSCQKCKDRGYSLTLRNGNLLSLPCSCGEVKKSVREMKASGLERTIREKTFARFQVTEDWQKPILSGAMAYAKEPDGWLLMCGQSGSGKTHLCTAICRELLLRSIPVLYMPWREKLAEIKAASLDGSRRGDLLNRCKEVKVLYIDDLFKVGRGPDGSCDPTRADIDLTFELINYRYAASLNTILSTERTVPELLRIDEALGSRIVEMAGKHIYSIDKAPGRNYRLRGR